jgi:FtsZ-binding cell division protein ZapB
MGLAENLLAERDALDATIEALRAEIVTLKEENASLHATLAEQALAIERLTRPDDGDQGDQGDGDSEPHRKIGGKKK